MPTPRAGYRTKDGVKRASVTQILGRFKDSGGLIKWAYKQGREHENLAMRNLPAPAHLYDNVEKAALAGTIAHDAIEQHILRGPHQGQDSMGFVCGLESAQGAAQDVMEKAHNAYLQFKQWLANTRLEVIPHERPLISERHGFGGTPDAYGKDSEGRVVLIDWKSSNKVYGEMLIQLAAYELLLEEVEGIKVTGGAHLLRVAKESADFAHHYYGDLTQEKKAFLLMRELYDIVYAVEKRA